MAGRITSQLLRLPVRGISCTRVLQTAPRLTLGLRPTQQHLRLCSNVPSSQPTTPQTATTTSKESTAAAAAESTVEETTTTTEDGYTVFFFFPNIRATRLMVRMKVYQTAMVLLPVPFCVRWVSTGMISPTAAYLWGGFAVLSTAALVFLSVRARGFVGRLALSKDLQTVQVSYLNFWGDREDDYVRVQDLVPFADLKGSPTDALIKLTRYDSDKYYTICIRNGGIGDKKRFEHVFGKFY